MAICGVAAAICLAFLAVCVWAWRLRPKAIQLLCTGYLLVGFMLIFNCALLFIIRAPAIGHERQVVAVAAGALILCITGIVVYLQIAILNDAS